MSSLLYFLPILLVIDPFVAFFFKRKNPARFVVGAKDMGEQLFKMARGSVNNLLKEDHIRLEKLGLTTLDTKFLHSELFIIHFFVITCVLQGILKKKEKETERDICDAMLGFFYPYLITQLGFNIKQVEEEQAHILERFHEYQQVLAASAKYWLLPLATRMVENIRGKDNDNFVAIDSMISEIALILNQVPLVFEKMKCAYSPIVPEFYALPPRPNLLTGRQRFEL